MNERPTTRLTVKGMELVAMFQPLYQSDSPKVSGELLTRPGAAVPVESYFASMEIADQFEILGWHLVLSVELSRICHASASINIHNSLIEDRDDRERFLELISRYSNSVTFEFTETYPMPPVETANRLLRRIRELGHSSALDDFGTGYNGMSLFTDYDFDVVKFDRSLSADLTADSDELRVLRLQRQMLDELGKGHVIEGVESEVVHELLLEAGFSTFQGHLFHQPVTVKEFLETCEVQR